MPSVEEVVAAGARCSLTKSVLAAWAASGTPRQREYLLGYLLAEGASRQASKRAQLLRRCAAPQAKSLEGYDWSSVSWPEGFGRADLEALSFVGPCEDLVLMGDVGTGKTHIASALCALACSERLEARFFTASSLVMRLRRARDEGRLDHEAAQIARARLLVVDELGCYYCADSYRGRIFAYDNDGNLLYAELLLAPRDSRREDRRRLPPRHEAQARRLRS